MADLSAQEKRDFIKYVVKHYQMKRRESVWILNYLISNDQLLENIHFVSEITTKMNRVMIMSTHASDNIPFRYLKEGVMTTDAEKGFHDIRLNRDEELYIQLYLDDDELDIQLLSVLEDDLLGVKLSREEKQSIDSLLKISLFDFQLQQINKQIDECLDTGDKEKFIELCIRREQLMLTEPMRNFTTVRKGATV